MTNEKSTIQIITNNHKMAGFLDEITIHKYTNLDYGEKNYIFL
jgi:hypothetical protein